MAIEDGAKGYVVFNGNPLAWCHSLRKSTETDQQSMPGLEGHLGWSPGTPMTRFTIGYRVKVSGTEDDFQDLAVQGAKVDIQMGFGPKAEITTCKIITNTVEQTAGSPTEGTLELEGPAAMLQ